MVPTREEHQSPEVRRRDDANFAHIAAWEHQDGRADPPCEPLQFTACNQHPQLQMKLTRIWRQNGAEQPGLYESHQLENVSQDLSLLEAWTSSMTS